MRVLCDANIGTIVARALAAAGHDVVRSVAIAPNASDLEILRAAVSEGRVLITCDRDFGELVFLRAEPAPPAILYVRYEPQDVEELVPRLLPLLATDDIYGYMTVVGTDRDRQTPFPIESNDNG